MTEARPPTGIPRFFEVVVAVCGLAVFAPVIAVAGVLIKTTSSGPIFFRQRRVGRLGKEFTLLKLRTMALNTDGPLVTASGDARVTAVGRLLRRSKIDELPELWNIVWGDMSLVGPRPEVPKLVDLRNPLWQEVLRARPGITDPVTLRLRNEEKLLADIADREDFYRDVLQPYKLNGYCRYLRSRSWYTDLKVVVSTMKAVLLPQTLPPLTEEEMASHSKESA